MAGAPVSLAAEIRVTRGSRRIEADLAVDPGAVLAILGPNGSGKTTTLRVLAGLTPGEGTVHLDGVVLDDPERRVHVAADRRPVGMLFQDYLLFPHLSVLDNVAFGLRTPGVSRAAARRDAAAWLARLGLDELGAERPAHLSGGQAQQVALARALARRPRLLLLDEPLAALDAGTRAGVRRDLRRYLDEFEGVTILVTHDPLDALALASEVVVLEEGQVTQRGTIDEITQRPRSRYVADLVGLNLLRGTGAGSTISLDATAGATPGAITTADPVEGPVYVLIHPHAVSVHTAEPAGSPRNRWRGRIEGFDLLGDRVRVRVGGDVVLVAEITTAAVAALDLREGAEVWTAVKATEVTTYPA